MSLSNRCFKVLSHHRFGHASGALFAVYFNGDFEGHLHTARNVFQLGQHNLGGGEREEGAQGVGRDALGNTRTISLADAVNLGVDTTFMVG